MKDINKFFKQEWESCLWNYEKHTRRKWFSNSPIRKGKRLIEFIKSAVQEIFKSNNFSCELCPSVQKKETGRKKKKKLGQHPSPRSSQPRFIFKRYFSDETDSGQGTREDFCWEKIHGRVSWDGATISFLPLFVLAQPTSLMNPTGRNPPHLRHCSFRKLSAEIRIFVSAPNVAFCLHYAPFVFYSDQRLQTTIWSCIRDPGYHFLRFSWRFLFFFLLFLYVLLESKEVSAKNIFAKKRFSSQKFKV